MKSTFVSLIRLLLVGAIMGLAMWLGLIVQSNIPMTLLILVAATLVVGYLIYSYDLVFQHLPKIFGTAPLIETIVVIVAVAKIARRNVLAIEEVLPSIANEFMRNGLRLVVDRVDRELIIDILVPEKGTANKREEQWLSQWKSMAYLVLTLGFLLSGYQIIRVQSLDLEAFQFYPLLLGGLICAAMIYFSFVIKDFLKDRAMLREMTFNAILFIEKNERPEFIEQFLLNYLPPKLRQTYEKLKLEWMNKRIFSPKTEKPQFIQPIRELNTPEGKKKIEEVLAKVNSRESITPDVMKEIREIMAKELEASKFDGVAAMAGMLNTMGETTKNSIQKTIEKSNPELAEQIREEMSAFENLVHIDASGTQAILKETHQIFLVRSLTTASDVLKKHIYQNMSKRAADMVRDDLEALGPVDITDVINAQQKIVQIARKLETEAKISVGDTSQTD